MRVKDVLERFTALGLMLNSRDPMATVYATLWKRRKLRGDVGQVNRLTWIWVDPGSHPRQDVN